MAADSAYLLTRRAALARLMALGTVGSSLPAPASASTLQLGSPAPPATLITLDGKRISTTDLSGQVVVLTFWATWCAPCREELPLLSTYAQRHAAQGLSVLAFSIDAPEDMRRVREVAQTFSFPTGLLANSSAPGYGRMWRIPVNFTIDGKGLLVDNGWLEKKPTWTAERLERIVTPLLNGTN